MTHPEVPALVRESPVTSLPGPDETEHAPPAARPGTPEASDTSLARRVRVCIVGPSLDILGGQAVQARRLLDRLHAVPTLDVEFLAVNPRLPGPLRALQRIKYVRTVATSVAYLAALVARLPRVDVVHAFSASYWSYVLAPLPAMAVGRALRKGVLLNYHSGEADDHLRRSRIAVRSMRRLADALVVPSGYLVDVFRNFGLRARAVPNHIDVERYTARVRETPRPVFLSNRTLEPLYNVACIVRAFARIQREVPDARLIVAGFGSQESALRALVHSLGLTGVEFRGRVAPDDMPRLYDEADVYLNSPNIDNMPLSVMEAFACALPVVSTDAGGVPYLVRDDVTGLLVPCDDDAALADAALRVLREPGLARRLGTEARRECLARYTWSAVEGEWVDVYHRLAGVPVPTAR